MKKEGYGNLNMSFSTRTDVQTRFRRDHFLLFSQPGSPGCATRHHQLHPTRATRPATRRPATRSWGAQVHITSDLRLMRSHSSNADRPKCPSTLTSGRPPSGAHQGWKAHRQGCWLAVPPAIGECFCPPFFGILQYIVWNRNYWCWVKYVAAGILRK